MTLLAALQAACAGEVLDARGSDRVPDPSSPMADAGGAAPPAVDVDGGPPELPPVGGGTACSDGIDNDGDGLVDWQRDLGCFAAADDDERAAPRADEEGWTTFDPPASGRIFYVSPTGNDAADGRDPSRAVRSVDRGVALVAQRPGGAWLLFERGGQYRGSLSLEGLRGASRTDRVVIASYGGRPERPVLVDVHASSAGQVDNVAIVGLRFYPEGRDPTSPRYVGTSVRGGVTTVGNVHGLLLEGNRFDYQGIVAHAYRAGDSLSDVEVRRNLIHHAYNTSGHASGLFLGSIDGVLIEENTLDHNGWLVQQRVSGANDQADGQATFFNHNMYIVGSQDVVIRRNLVLRAASIGVKFRADTTGQFRSALVEENVIYEGEVALSAGGNTDAALRFVDFTVRDNAVLHTGRARPTNRDLGWMLGFSDHENLEVTGNLLLHQRDVGNSYAIELAPSTMRNVNVHGNVVYAVRGANMRVQAASAYESVRIADNVLEDPGVGARLVEHSGGFGAVRYENNTYTSTGAAASWFAVDGGGRNLDAWRTASGESTARSGTQFPDPTRDLASYDAQVGGDGTFAHFIDAVYAQSPWGWRPELTAGPVVQYLAAGFR